MAFPAPQFGSAEPVAGSDGTNAYTLLTDTSGRLIIKLVDSTGGVVTAIQANADAQSGTPVSLSVVNRNTVYNGATWDREAKAFSTARLLSAAATTNATVVKASAGNIHKITGYSARASLCYLKLYNKATSPTVGTDTPIWTEVLTATGKFSIDFGDQPLYFATGIGYAITTAGADADTGALTLADITGMNIAYS